ncbi:hypothetical protein EZV73_24220 [Acidaminobacter sp. JC074]|uniref:hypothetical protein n=1 Tax=Acidaminobacter sp. JC074 TaxID=2530199 RepID=UPI001F0D9A01|nr:hypothetical protein [Acidaminobacter sp. JC074]MCH4890708.1 hypothetical protein [Acidaminobacter sp. JC074]
MKLFDILKSRMVPLFALFILFMVLVLPMTSDYMMNKDTPDPMLSYTQEDIIKIAEELGDQGRTNYIRSRLFMDVLWPLVYACTFYMILCLFYRETRLKFLVILPLIGMVFDFLENILMVHQMHFYPSINTSIIAVSSFFTSSKWLILGMVAVLMVLGFVYQFIKYVRHNMS